VVTCSGGLVWTYELMQHSNIQYLACPFDLHSGFLAIECVINYHHASVCLSSPLGVVSHIYDLLLCESYVKCMIAAL
jgi:hypothetical protein